MKFFLRICHFAALAACLVRAEASESSSETGVIVVASTNGSAVNYLGVPVAPPVAMGGVVTGVSSSLPGFTAAGDDWTRLAALAGKAWFMEIGSGPAAGWWSRVVALDVEARTATLEQPPPTLLAPGAAYRLRRALTVGELLGSANAAQFDAASSPSAGDVLIVADAATQAQATFFRSSVSGYAGWYDAAYAPAGDMPLWPGQAVIVRRRSSGARELAFAGVLLTEPLLVRLEPGVNLVSHQIPGTASLLAEAGLLAAGLEGGASAATADLVLLPQGDGSLTAHFYSTIAGDTGWKTADGTAAGGATWAADGALLVRRQSAPVIEWNPIEKP